MAPVLGLRAAFCAGIYTSIIAAMIINPGEAYGERFVNGERFLIFLDSVVLSLAGAIMMRRIRKRSYLLITGGVTSILILMFVILGSPFSLIGFEGWKPNLIATFSTGFGMVIIANFILPLLEYLFNMTTDQSLLELNDLNHPLLKRLQLEAPGTYHHSLMVATLAEAAAEAIGVHPLLTRVCAYFHDIGKLGHPEYFTENTRQIDSPHDDLHPHMSSMIILNHVKEGLSLAYKYKLKKAFICHCVICKNYKLRLRHESSGLCH